MSLRGVVVSVTALLFSACVSPTGSGIVLTHDYISHSYYGAELGYAADKGGMPTAVFGLRSTSIRLRSTERSPTSCIAKIQVSRFAFPTRSTTHNDGFTASSCISTHRLELAAILPAIPMRHFSPCRKKAIDLSSWLPCAVATNRYRRLEGRRRVGQDLTTRIFII